MIHIGRAGTKLGSFSEFEVRRGLASGRFFLTDLGWKQGMENWAPLSTFPEFAPETPEPMPPLPEPAAVGPAEADPARPGLPWDYRKEIGFARALVQTAWMILVSPAEAFARMRITGPVAGPLLYNMIGGWIGAVASATYLVLTLRVQPPPTNLSGPKALFYLPPSMALRELEVVIVIGPIIVTVTTLIASAIAHLLLMLAGGANRDFHVTLRVLCFTYGSAQLLQLIPVCGNFMTPVWMLVCSIVGLAVAHGTTAGRSATAMILFMMAFFVCCLGALFLALGADPQSMRSLLNQ
jgi:hypothetical protein